MKHSLVFIATTPFAVNAFLRTHLLALAEAHDVTLCVNTTVYPLVEDVARAVRVRHVDIARKISPWQDFRALFQLLCCFREIRPSVVHSTTPKAGLLAMWAAWMVGVPWRFHTFTGQVWANKTGVGRSLMKGVDRLIAVCASRVFADSASQCRFLEDEGVVRRGGIIVLGQGSVAGVDLARFHPSSAERDTLRAEMGISNDDFVFLFVGRLVRDKGVFDLVNAFAGLNIQYKNWELWMVGPNEEGLEAKLQAQVKQLGVRIRWIGPKPNPERFMAAADILVLPSYREGFGSVIIEAAACGIPTIAYRIDGVVDAVIDDSTGCLVPKGDIIAFSQAMQRLACDPKALRNLSQAARKRAIGHFSSSTVTAAWLAFYESELKKSDIERDRCCLSRYEMTIKAKRTFDLVIVFLTMPFLAPSLIFITVFVCLTSPGPALYWSNRVGRGNKLFEMPKFRSMRIDTPVTATHLLQSPSQWLTPIGSFLRRTSLDELPQLWSILKGEMSFVGPRPALFNQGDLISLRTDAGVHKLLPGLTGWAQVNGRDELSIPDKVKLDAEYLERRSVGFDLWILWLTLLKVLRRDGISH